MTQLCVVLFLSDYLIMYSSDLCVHQLDVLTSVILWMFPLPGWLINILQHVTKRRTFSTIDVLHFHLLGFYLHDFKLSNRVVVSLTKFADGSLLFLFNFKCKCLGWFIWFCLNTKALNKFIHNIYKWFLFVV